MEAFACTLHDMGVIMWQNAPVLNKVVIVDLQWFADALSSVVGLLTKDQAARDGGYINIMAYISDR